MLVDPMRRATAVIGRDRRHVADLDIGRSGKDETPGSPSHRRATEPRLTALRCRGRRWWGVSRSEELVLLAMLLSIAVRSTRGRTTPEFLLDAPFIEVSLALAYCGRYRLPGR